MLSSCFTKDSSSVLKRNVLVILFLTFFVSNTKILSQNLPPINNYTSKVHGGGNQNWSISQAEDKFIYVANNKGLLEYNGAQWSLYLSPNETIFRSVNVIDDKIYTGFYMDFGYWERNSKGKLEYTSLVNKLNIDVNEDEQFWGIIELDGYILFQSLSRIYLFNTTNQEISVIESKEKLTKMFKVDKTIYFHKEGKGLFKIQNGVAKLFSNDNLFASSEIINIFKRDNGFLIITDTKGAYYFDGEKISAWLETSAVLSNKTIYSAIKLNNGGMVLGTISNGAIFFNENGNVNYKIEQENGLNNNTVLSIFEDKDYNIWLGLDNGINSINVSSNIKVYKNNHGNLGTVYASILHNENLYLGSNQGLFYKKYGSNDEFKFIPKTEGQVWNLRVINNTLFCNHDSGLFVISNNNLGYIIDKQGSWDIKYLNENTLVSGNYSGLSVIKRKNGRWVFNNKILGFNNSSKHFELYSDKLLFVNHEYKGVFKINVNSNFTKALSVKRDTSVAKGIHSSLVKYNDELLYASKKGIFKYNDKKSLFIKDSNLSSIYTDSTFVSGKLIFDEKNDRLWSVSDKYLNYISPGKLSNTPTISKVPISKSMREGATGYENIYSLNESQNLIGTNDGFIIIDIENQNNSPKNIVYINSVTSHELDNTNQLLDQDQKVVLPYTANNFEFQFSTPQFKKALDVEYQYMLEGLNTGWSNWSNHHSVIYENLSFGNYTFKVRSKVGDNISDNVATYPFRINRPWYWSNLMIVAYCLGFFLMLLLIHFLNRRYYKRKGRKQLEKQQREFKLQELEKEKQLVLLKNEQLKTDVDSKNRELASSTMSMIKKNQFLNAIKNELKRIDAVGISRVIKIIDKNLNNKDDWKLFEEAFNNADKGFIKKVKAIHPDLTPNDLRLCAYLRLNLPSKEIAPLLNISPRSVEVKRYRLRKKMNLDHKENLTDYILNL